MRISRQDFSLIGLIILLDLIVFTSVFSGNLLDELNVNDVTALSCVSLQAHLDTKIHWRAVT